MEKGYISGMLAGVMDAQADTISYGFLLDLTDAGMENHQLVLNDIFSYIRFVRMNGITLEKYKQLRTESLLNFMYQRRESGFMDVV